MAILFISGLIWFRICKKNMPLSQFFPAHNSPLPYFSPRSYGHFSWIQVSPSNNWNLLCKSSSCSSGLMVGLAIGPAIGLAAANFVELVMGRNWNPWIHKNDRRSSCLMSNHPFSRFNNFDLLQLAYRISQHRCSLRRVKTMSKIWRFWMPLESTIANLWVALQFEHILTTKFH